MTKEEFIEIYKKAKTIREVADQLGVSNATIVNYAKKFKLKKKRTRLILEPGEKNYYE